MSGSVAGSGLPDPAVPDPEVPDRDVPDSGLSGGHGTDCSTVLAEVWLLLDRECGPERDAQLRRHLHECGPCLARYGLEEKIKTLLARTCGGDRAPDELHRRLREQIRSTVLEQATVSVDRGPGGTVVEVNQTRVEVREY